MKDKVIKVAEKDYKVIEIIAEKERRSLKTTLAQAIRNFGIAKKVEV